MPSEGILTRSTRLEPRVRYVTRNAVTKKWKRVPPTSCETINEIITAAKKQTRTKQKKNTSGLSEVESHLQDIASRLMQQVPRMLFPPSTNDNDFDYEATLNRTSYLEDQLTSNQQSIHLLRAQIKREEVLLKEDKQEVGRLDQAFKSNTAFRRQQSKSLHPITKTTVRELSNQQHKQPLIATGKVDFSADESSWARDQELQAILKQLRSHLGSMANNVSDVQQLGIEMQALHQVLSVFWHSRPEC